MMIKLFAAGLVICTASVSAVDISAGSRPAGDTMKPSQREGPPKLTMDTWDVEFKKTPDKTKPILVKFDTNKCPKC